MGTSIGSLQPSELLELHVPDWIGIMYDIETLT